MHYLVGLGGYARSGKDAVANVLFAEHGWHKTYMSAPLEKALLTLDPVIPTWPRHWDNNWYYVSQRVALGREMRYSDLHAALGYDDTKLNLEVRRLLQTLGTEIGRNMLGENVWVDMAFGDVDVALASRSVAITGIRFPNELAALRSRGGVSVWVSRPGFEAVNAHSSDNTLSAEDFDVVLNNEGDLEDLLATTKALLHSFTGYAATTRVAA